ncbi:MAG: ankyrin repeat domain-containing protein [Bdellovibrionales bacterium]
MTTRKLPSQPSLHQLRKQAKELTRAFRAGDIEARDRIASQAKKAADELLSGQSRGSLSVAQLTIAREYGFESWPKLKFFVEAQAMTFEQKLKSFVSAATNNRLYYAQFLLQHEPRLATHDLSTACLVGQYASVERAVEKNPAVVSIKTGLNDWEPLLYVCFSFFHAQSPETAENLLKIAHLLIANGADVNTSYAHSLEDVSADTRIPALYGPSGATNFPELAEILLKAGANPDERESLYHSTEFRDRKCMYLLLEYGANAKKWGALHHILDYDDLEGVEILLKAGADPNCQYENLGTALHHAIVRGRGLTFIERLLFYGADPLAKNPQGHTAYETAIRFGHCEAKSFFEHRFGLQKDLSQPETFVAACAAPDPKTAKEILARDPEILKRLPAGDLRLVADFAALGKVESVLLMLDVGFEINQRGEWGGSVLQQAAWHGQAEMVDLLIERGADLEMLNNYQGTALGATIFATEYLRVPESDTRYIAIAESLLEAGAKLLPHHLTMGSESMTEFLKTYSSDQ